MRCCFCKKKILNNPNNALPIKSKYCCEYCNTNIVIPSRLFIIQNYRESKSLFIRNFDLKSEDDLIYTFNKRAILYRTEYSNYIFLYQKYKNKNCNCSNQLFCYILIDIS